MKKLAIIVLALLAVFMLAIGLGSVYIPPLEIVRAVWYRFFGAGEDISGAYIIMWELRLPRALLAFIVGAALSVSGAVMQSVLRNPLASSFTLGVSSGASLGAALVIFAGMSALFSLPTAGFLFGMGAIVLAIALASKMDGRLENNTIILVGMVLSLFVNAITTMLMAMRREYMERLVFWQMGSFSMRGWEAVAILAPVAIIGIIFILFYHRELDIMTFGENEAQLIGVNMRRVKWVLLVASAALTGSAIAFVGIIGFVDLVAPHVVRRAFGARHRLLIPMSAAVGGGFMMLCDLVARTVLPVGELPVGVVSALVGAPFFAYVYFAKRG
ncbi:MAG: iron ABC transporter permease [Defluviitaleaceae bacterium]|nr:iron ABC transporter permease [Defluviitaleaceae bacterium]